MGQITRAIAICNNEVALIAWDIDGMIDNCLGFDITRVYPATGERKRLATWVPFEGQDNPDWKPQDTGVWPIQKTFWRDLTLRQRRDKTEQRPSNVRVKYEIRPVGKMAPGLEAVTGTPPKTYQGPVIPLGYLGPAVTTNEIFVTSDFGDVQSAFTNGILAAQWLDHLYPGGWTKANQQKLRTDIATPGNDVRGYLSGDVLPLLESLLLRAARDGGRVHLALYELADPELVKLLVDHAGVIDIILSNTSADKNKVWDTENAAARQKLKDAGANIQDRMFNNGHIGHNKFSVYVDAGGTPQTVLTGSTNWTSTGLCAQTNNSSLIDNPAIAKGYLDYWQRLHDDVLPPPDPLGAPTSNAQGQALRSKNQMPTKATMKNGATATAWFLPDTKQTNKPATQAALTNPSLRPPDLKDLFARIDAAKQAVFFLVFLPSQGGLLSVVEEARKAGEVNPNLLVVGAVSDPTAMPGYQPKANGAAAVSPSVYDQRHTHIVRASSLGTNDVVGNFETELLSLGHAIVHDKIVVIDPMSDKPTVAFGSHNLGYKASYENDENLIIIEGNQALARAYATHVYDIYDHYRFRAWQHTASTAGSQKFTGHIAADSNWLQAYVKGPKGDISAYLLGEPMPAVAASTTAATTAATSKRRTAPASGKKKAAKKKPAKKPGKKAAPKKKATKKVVKKTVKKVAKKKAVKKATRPVTRKKKTARRKKSR